jgi:predicted outer membrane repeat protein
MSFLKPTEKNGIKEKILHKSTLVENFATNNGSAIYIKKLLKSLQLLSLQPIACRGGKRD